MLVGLAFSANAFDTPECPQTIIVKNGEIERVEKWEVAYASYLLTLKNRRVDGHFSTDSRAPAIGLQHSVDDVAGLGADNIDEFMEEREIYPNRYWTYNENFSGKYVFLCEANHGGYMLYKPVTEKFSKCTQVKSGDQSSKWQEHLVCE